MAAKREIKTPGVTAEQNQEEQKVVAPEPEQDTSTKGQAEAALSEILSAPHEAIIPAQEDAPEWVAAILEGQARLEQKLDAILSQSNAGTVPKPKGRFKLVDGKGHVWVEG